MAASVLDRIFRGFITYVLQVVSCDFKKINLRVASLSCAIIVLRTIMIT